MKDALNRRSRFARPQPFFVETKIERNLDLFQNIDRHGPLPTPLIVALDRRKNYGDLQRLLTRLYNGSCDHPDHHSENPDHHVCRPTTYLSRDPRQWKNFHARYQPAVYGLTEHTRDLLQKHGRLARPFKRSNSFVHDLFLSCFTASFELQARKFRFRDELLDHRNCPDATRQEASPFYFTSASKEVHPDDILSNEYEEGKSRFFALEIDCANESNDKTETKLKDYQEVLRSRSYSTRLGLPNMTILYPTVTTAKAEKILAFVERYIEPRYQPHFLTKVFPEFGDPWRISKDPLEVMTGWRSVRGTEDISKKATA